MTSVTESPGYDSILNLALTVAVVVFSLASRTSPQTSLDNSIRICRFFELSNLFSIPSSRIVCNVSLPSLLKDSIASFFFCVIAIIEYCFEQ